MTKSLHSYSKLKKGGSDEKLWKVRGVRPRQREIQNADIHQAWTLCQVHLTNIPRSFRSFHKSDKYQYLEKYSLWNTSSQENCHSIHWHCGWVSNHQVATLSQLFARNGLHLLPAQGLQHCGCGQCYPHTLRHLWGRRPASLVSLQNFNALEHFSSRQSCPFTSGLTVPTTWGNPAILRWGEESSMFATSRWCL